MHTFSPLDKRVCGFTVPVDGEREPQNPVVSSGSREGEVRAFVYGLPIIMNPWMIIYGPPIPPSRNRAPEVELRVDRTFSMVLSAGSLPTTLRKLTFNKMYDLPIDARVLPPGLETLIFGQFGGNYRLG